MFETIFVTGGTGFIGQYFVHHALAAGYTVQVLTRSERSAAAVQATGAIPVAGDLLTPGSWQQTAAAADYVVHVAQPQTFGGRVTQARADVYRRDRLKMDANLLNHLSPATTKRVVYVAGTSYYGEQGTDLRDETTTPVPRGWGPYIQDAILDLQRHHQRGLPVIEAYPGAIYGPGSWYAGVLEPLAAGKRLVGLQRGGTPSSSMHVDDCARAILHLLQNGTAGERYFLVDDVPSTTGELAQLSAEALGVPLRALIVPRWLARLIVGPVIADSLSYGNRLSNAKLKATGFVCTYPSLKEGVPDVVRRWRADRAGPTPNEPTIVAAR